MKTYFAVSDIHSYATVLKDALRVAGFRKSNKDHILIVNGDIFDRGPEPLEVYNFLRSIPKFRRVLVKGNHELLFLELLTKKFPESHDFSNGTVTTFCKIAGKPQAESILVQLKNKLLFDSSCDRSDGEKLWAEIRESVSSSPITSWLKSTEWNNFYELGRYIFVHSFIPVILNSNPDLSLSGNMESILYKPDNNWRNASEESWLKATWGCPFKLFDAGLFNMEIENNKILVCGHWRASDFHNNYKDSKVPQKMLTADNKLANTLPLFANGFDSIYIGEHLIALDTCTVLTNKINVLVLTENEVNSDE